MSDPIAIIRRSARRLAVLCGFMLLPFATAAQASQITLASDPALTGSTLIDFNNEPDANFFSKTILGVTFTAGPSFGAQLGIASYLVGGDDGAGSGQVLHTAPSPDAFQIAFSTPVSAFAMLWLGSNVDWTVNLYNSSNTLLETLVFAPPTTQPTNKFYGATNNGISYVTLVAAGGFDFMKIDDFQFVPQSTTGSPVPEPGTMMLFATGAVALFGLRRTRYSVSGSE